MTRAYPAFVRQAEVAAAETMIDRTAEQALPPDQA
jgi:hypothetical protein